jgi:hypothetical protein
MERETEYAGFSVQKILADVYDKEIEESTETAKKSTGWRSSSLGSCKRGQFLGRLLSGDFKVQHDRRTMDVFEIGNIVEDIKIAKLKKHPDYLIITQGEMADPQRNLTGHFDALIIKKATGEPFMFECKSKNSRAFTYMDKKREGAMYHHQMQINSYMNMCNNYGFALADLDNDLMNPVYNWLNANAKIIGWVEVKHPEMKKTHPTKPVWKLTQQIKEGSILYVSKDDQRLLEYPVFDNDQKLFMAWASELDLLNRAWNNKDVLPEEEKGAWQTKYCQYCQAGLCEKLSSKEVVEDLFTTVALEDEKREKLKLQESCTHEQYHLGKCIACSKESEANF